MNINPKIRLLSVGGALGLLILVVNLPVLDFDWVYFDDDINVLLNPHLTGGGLETLHWAWTEFDYTRRFMPLGWMMFDALFAWGGLNPALYHFAGWLLSAGNGVLLFLITRQFLMPELRPGSDPLRVDLAACLAVALLCLHPWRAETAGWCSGLLYLFAQFLASIAVLLSLKQPSPSRFTSLLFFLLSLLVYPVLLGLPLILIAGRFQQTSHTLPTPTALVRLRLAIGEYSGWLAASLIVGGLNWYAAHTVREGFNAAAGLSDYTLGDHWYHFSTLLSHYAGRFFWPGETSAYYGPMLHQVETTFGPIVSCSLFAAWIILMVHPRSRARAIFAMVLFVVSLLPYSGLLDQDQTANDRYSLVLLGVVTVAMAGLLNRAVTRYGSMSVAGPTIALAILLMPAYRSSLSIWRNTDALQARLDRVTADHPNIRLSYARPAVTDYLRGYSARSKARLEAGESRFGPNAEILAAGKFIDEVHSRIVSHPASGSMDPPYAWMHLDLAQNHRDRGNLRAADIHQQFARRLLEAKAH